MSRILYVLIGVFFVACVNRTENVKVLNQYANSLSYFPSELVSHFPRRLVDTSIIAINTIAPNGIYANQMARLFLTLKLGPKEIDSLYTAISAEGIDELTPNDTTLIIIGDTIDYSSMTSGTPIPSFVGLRSSFGMRKSHLPDDYSLFIIETRPGEYLDKKYLTNNLDLPSNWKNGYSRGIAISRKRGQVIYWLAIW